MAGYRRFIAYVYEYPDGKKGNGKGFIKVESRDGICRMQYRLSGVCSSVPVPAKIYGYVREKQSCKGFYLEAVTLQETTSGLNRKCPLNIWETVDMH